MPVNSALRVREGINRALDHTTALSAYEWDDPTQPIKRPNRMSTDPKRNPPTRAVKNFTMADIRNAPRRETLLTKGIDVPRPEDEPGVQTA